MHTKNLSFLISQPKHVVGTQKNHLIEHPVHMLKLMGMKKSQFYTQKRVYLNL